MNALGSKWMSKLPDEIKLSQLTIPGTHNSLAVDCSPFAKCQKMPLNYQLNYGIRYLDIRCRHVKDEFKLHHSSFDLNAKFDIDCLNVCYEFLISNPSEVIIMLVSSEHNPSGNTLKFEDVFKRYLDKHLDKWYLDENCPSLGQVRGKIVLFRRFFSPYRPLGIDMSGWRFNQTFRIKNHDNFGFLIQDECNLSAGSKWSQVKQLLDVTNSNLNDMNTWYMNYCSSQNWPLQPPIYIAWSNNKNLLNYLKNESFAKIQNLNKNQTATLNSFNLGILVLDFVEEEIIENIFLVNFRS